MRALEPQCGRSAIRSRHHGFRRNAGACEQSTVLDNTDWVMLRAQKLAPIGACKTKPALEGLPNWVDCLRDAAENMGYPMFGDE